MGGAQQAEIVRLGAAAAGIRHDVIDLQARFFLYVVPADAEDLAAQDRPHGFENRGFDFREHRVRLGEACVALVPMPEYEIARLRTGQSISGQGQFWSAEIAAPATAQGP